MRIQPFADLHINEFSGAGITELESGITNGVISKANGKVYLTQRPSIDVFEVASVETSDARGRAIFYWEATDALYILNNGTLYKDSQGVSISTAPTAGTKKCKFLLLLSTLILIDTENNQAFTITPSNAVTEITDVNFPPNHIPAKSLAYGNAVMDQYLFVMDTEGTIYNSNVGDPTVFNALDFINAEREPDAGVYLGKHHTDLVALGAGTIEYFYNASNTVGSPLSRRQDMSYNIGCSSGETVHEEADRLFFVGTNHGGALGVYTIENYTPRKISSDSLDSFLTQAIVKDGHTAFGSGLTAQGHIFYILTLHITPDDITPELSLVYDDTTGFWGIWDTEISDLSKYPLIDWTRRTGGTQRYGEGIMSNGDLFTLNDNLIPIDTVLGSDYVEDDYVEEGYVVSAAEEGAAITLTSRVGMFDADTNNFKYGNSIRTVGNTTTDPQDLTVRWADENSATASFNVGRDIDMSIYEKLTRIGRFRRRNHEIETTSEEQVQIEALEIDADLGDN